MGAVVWMGQNIQKKEKERDHHEKIFSNFKNLVGLGVCLQYMYIESRITLQPVDIYKILVSLWYWSDWLD